MTRVDINEELHVELLDANEESTAGHPETIREYPRVTYWSVYDQRWIRAASAIDDRELPYMPADVREIVIAHLAGSPEVVEHLIAARE